MAITSGFFNAQKLDDGTYDRVYNAEEMSNYYKGLFTNGVVPNVNEELKVTAGTGMGVTVGAGRAIIEGKWFEVTEAESLTLEAGNEYYINVILKEDSREITVEAVLTTAETTEPHLTLAVVTVPSDASSSSDFTIALTRTFLEYALEIKENTELEEQVAENTANIATLESQVGITYNRQGNVTWSDKSTFDSITLSGGESSAVGSLGALTDNPIPPIVLLGGGDYLGVEISVRARDNGSSRHWNAVFYNKTEEEVTVYYKILRIQANHLEIVD